MALLRAAAHCSTGRDRDRPMLDFTSVPRDPVSNSASPRHHVPAQARDRGAVIMRRVPMKRIPSKTIPQSTAVSNDLDGTGARAHAAIRHYGDAAAAFASASSAAAMALTAASTSWPSPCRFASQSGSLYESHVLPDASCQTSALSGRSMPMVWADLHERRATFCIAEDQELGRPQR